MIEPATSVRLLIALTVLVYAYLVARSPTPASRRLFVAVAGLLPFFVWAMEPDLLTAGAFAVPLPVRRLSLLVGGVAVVTRYAAVRARDRNERQRERLALVSAGFLLVAVTVASANWLVASAMTIALTAASRVNLSAGSSGEDRSQSHGL